MGATKSCLTKSKEEEKTEGKPRIFRPPSPSYTIVTDPETNRLRFGRMCAPVRAKNMEIVEMTTKRKQRIVGVLIRHEEAKLTLLHSHGNGSDLGEYFPLYEKLSNDLKMNVFGYDYSGYGACTGEPSEANTYADIDAALDCLLKRFQFRKEDIVLFGHSLGSGPSVDLASRVKNLRGVILQSPILSAYKSLGTIYKVEPGDEFKNMNKIGKIKCPILIIHGTADSLVDFSHAKKLFELCKHPYEPLWIEGGSHNFLESKPGFSSHLLKFINFLEN